MERTEKIQLISLAGIFLLLALGISAAGMIYYNNEATSQKNRALANMAAIVALKTGEIKLWRYERMSDARVLRENPFVVEWLRSLDSGRSNAQDEKELKKFLDVIASNYRYGNWILYSPQDEPLMHSAAADLDIHHERYWKDVHQEKTPFMTDLHLEEHGLINMDLVIPYAIDKSVFTVVFEINPKDFLYPFIQSWPAASKSGETLLVERSGDEILFLNDLRNKKDTALKLRTPLLEDLPAVKAVNRISTTMEGRDYRGIPVLAATGYIEGTPWGLVSKVDVEEVLRPLKNRLAFVILSSILLIIASGISILFLWQRQKNAIRLAGALKYKEIAAELAATRDRLLEAQQISHLGNWSLDIKNGDLEWSDEIYRIFGFEPQQFEATYRAFMECIHPDDRQKVTHALDRSVAGDVAYDIDHRIVLPDGEVRIVHELGKVFRDESGEALRMLGIVLDITDQTHTKKAIVEAKEAAEQASRAKSEFLANMSHEIRTPMTSIIGMAELLSETGLDEEQNEYIERLRNSGDALIGIINDILDISKIEAGQVELEEIEFNLVAEIDRILSVFRSKMEKKGIALNCTLSPTLPKTFIGDPARLRQVLINIIGNAVKFTDSGEIAIEADCAGCDDGEEVCRLQLSIRDTGIGIEPEKLESIFSEFVQADASTTRLYGGTGLGLAISKKLVQLMGGEIAVKSTTGQGSTFFVTFDMKRGAGEGTEEAVSDVVPVEKYPEGAEGGRILLAEDAEDNRLLVKAFLKGTPHTLDMAEDGEKAFERFTAGEYDLVLMDMQMPVMDGYEATRIIRKWEEEKGLEKTPIVAFTAHALTEEVARCMKMGCTAHIAKPVRKKNLLAAISEHLSK